MDNEFNPIDPGDEQKHNVFEEKADASLEGKPDSIPVMTDEDVFPYGVPEVVGVITTSEPKGEIGPGEDDGSAKTIDVVDVEHTISGAEFVKGAEIMRKASQDLLGNFINIESTLRNVAELLTNLANAFDEAATKEASDDA